jgi:predicted nucleotide-binding protein
MTIRQELTELADLVSKQVDRTRAPDLETPMRSLEAQCDIARKAWSGSNIGHHANVYWQGLRPHPANSAFNIEWGFAASWPNPEPDPEWQIMEPAEVTAELLRRAHITDLKPVRLELKSLRQELSDLKEQAISMLNVILRDQPEAFFSRQLGHIESLSVASPREIAPSLVPPGQWSRDSDAIAQGIQVAPHQHLAAVHLSYTHTRNGLETLEKAVRVSASHAQRLENLATGSGPKGENIVIGHGQSEIWKQLRDFLRDRVKLRWDEFNRVPVAGVPNTIRLTQMLEQAGMAFIVLTGEDEQVDGTTRARQNVIHEAGLFQAKLGFTRAIILLEEGCEEFSNIAGLGQVRFPKNNIGAVFEEIRRVLEREGMLKV